jgi:hypothetical protein
MHVNWTLVIKLDPELYLTGILRLVGKPKRCGKLHISPRLVENKVGVIENIEELRAKLQPGFFRESNSLHE